MFKTERRTESDQPSHLHAGNARYWLMKRSPTRMGKQKPKSAIIGTLRSYTSNATVHGLSYIGDLTLPVVDRLVWLVVVVVFGSCAAYLSHGVFKEWQSNKVVTTLRETELPITELDFPAITICSEGLDMEAVEKVIENDFEEWKKENKANRAKRDVDEEEEVKNFLENIYGIKGDASISDIIMGMVADNPDTSFASNGIRKP